MKKKVLSLVLVAAMAMSMTACGGNKEASTSSDNSADVPSIDQLKVGEDYKDLKADIKILTNRTDIVDTVYKGYADQFHELYPNITVTYEAVTDYEESLTLRLTNGDWGDICFIPTSCDKSEFSTYFTEVLSGDYPVSTVLEAALYGNESLDDLMNEWNEKWTSAQESCGAEITE